MQSFGFGWKKKTRSALSLILTFSLVWPPCLWHCMDVKQPSRCGQIFQQIYWIERTSILHPGVLDAPRPILNGLMEAQQIIQQTNNSKAPLCWCMGREWMSGGKMRGHKTEYSLYVWDLEGKKKEYQYIPCHWSSIKVCIFYLGRCI